MGLLAVRRRTAQPKLRLAYASVGQAGDFGNSRTDDSSASTWTIAFGAGWLYGLGLCIGPFFGAGVGLTIPGGVIAGAGGGVGVVFGVGMGGGFVWGAGRGQVRGFGVTPPMMPPFAEGLPQLSEIPSPSELARRTAEFTDVLRARAARRGAELRVEWQQRQRGGERDTSEDDRPEKPLAFVVRPSVGWGAGGGVMRPRFDTARPPRRGGSLSDPRWPE